MKIIFIGDIVGRSGRKAVSTNLDHIKEKFKPDIIIANAENAASGYGLTKKIAKELFDQGYPCLNSWKSCMGSKRNAFIYRRVSKNYKSN